MLKFYYNSTIMGDPSLLNEIRSLDQVYTPNVGSRLNRTVIHKDKRLYLELNIDINLCEIVVPQSFDLDSLKADFINEILNFLLASLRAFPVDTVNEMGFKLIFYVPNDSQASTDQWWSTTRLINYSWSKTATNCNRTFLGKNEFKTPHSRFTLKFFFNQDRELIREPAVNSAGTFASGNNVGTNFVGTFDTTFGGGGTFGGNNAGGINNQFGGVNNQNTFGSVNTGGTSNQFGTTNNQSTFGGTNNQFGTTNIQSTFTGATNNQSTFGGVNTGATNNQNTFGTNNTQNNQNTFGGTNNTQNNQSTFGGTNNPQNNQSTFGGTNNPQNNQSTFGGTNNPQNNQNIFGGTNSQFPSWGVGSNTQTSAAGSAFSGFNTGQMTIGDWGAKW